MTRVLTPKAHEPIRLVETASGPRYRVVIDTAPKGAPRKQVSRNFASLPDARAFVRTTRDDLANGNFAKPAKTTINELCEEWVQSRRDVRAKTIRGYRDALGPVRARLGNRPAQSLQPKDVEDLVDWLGSAAHDGQPYAQRTIALTLGTLKQVLNYGVRTGSLRSNAADGVKPPRRTKRDQKRIVPWDREELMAFRAAADDDEYAAAWRLTLCGLRRSEILGLSWDDIDLDAGTVHVGWSRVVVASGETARDDTKSAASERTVYVDELHPGTGRLLRALRRQQREDALEFRGIYANASRLIVVDRLGRAMYPDVYSARFRALCEKADVPRIGIHTVRHSVARIMHLAGVAPADAAALLGHTLAVHLTVYVTRTERGAQAAGAALGAALSAAN